MSLPPNATDVIFIGKPFSFRQNCFEQKLESRTGMVCTKFRTVNCRALTQLLMRVLIQADALVKGGVQRAMESQQGVWSAQEMKNHINFLELLAIKRPINCSRKP